MGLLHWWFELPLKKSCGHSDGAPSSEVRGNGVVGPQEFLLEWRYAASPGVEMPGMVWGTSKFRFKSPVTCIPQARESAPQQRDIRRKTIGTAISSSISFRFSSCRRKQTRHESRCCRLAHALVRCARASTSQRRLDVCVFVVRGMVLLDALARVNVHFVAQRQSLAL